MAVRVLDFNECRAWCESVGVRVDATNATRLYVNGARHTAVYVGEVAEGAEASFDVAEELIGAGRPDAFAGALLWELSRGHGAVQDALFARVVAGHGVSAPDRPGHGYLFAAAERVEAAALVGLCLDFATAFYCVPAHGNYFIRGVADRLVDVVVSDETWDARLRPIMEAWSWDANRELRASLVRQFINPAG